MPSLLIRPMRRQDVPEVAAVDRLCFTCCWSEAAFAAELTNTIGYYLVAELDGRVVGYIGSHLVMDEAHITTIGVHPDLRRRHVGERLLHAVLAEALRSGCRRVTLEVRESNRAARRLYGKYGFSPVSRRPRYYPDNGEDAVVMWIEDLTRPWLRELLEARTGELEELDGLQELESKETAGRADP